MCPASLCSSTSMKLNFRQAYFTKNRQGYSEHLIQICQHQSDLFAISSSKIPSESPANFLLKMPWSFFWVSSWGKECIFVRTQQTHRTLLATWKSSLFTSVSQRMCQNLKKYPAGILDISHSEECGVTETLGNQRLISLSLSSKECLNKKWKNNLHMSLRDWRHMRSVNVSWKINDNDFIININSK